MITLLVRESLFRKGALHEKEFITARGRVNGLSQSASCVAETSGPRRLNRASLPSKVPWPSKISQRGGPAVGFSRERAARSNSKSFVSFVALRPIVSHWH